MGSKQTPGICDPWPFTGLCAHIPIFMATSELELMKRGVKDPVPTREYPFAMIYRRAWHVGALSYKATQYQVPRLSSTSGCQNIRITQ